MNRGDSRSNNTKRKHLREAVKIECQSEEFRNLFGTQRIHSFPSDRNNFFFFFFFCGPKIRANKNIRFSLQRNSLTTIILLLWTIANEKKRKKKKSWWRRWVWGGGIPKVRCLWKICSTKNRTNYRKV